MGENSVTIQTQASIFPLSLIVFQHTLLLTHKRSMSLWMINSVIMKSRLKIVCSTDGQTIFWGRQNQGANNSIPNCSQVNKKGVSGKAEKRVTVLQRMPLFTHLVLENVPNKATGNWQIPSLLTWLKAAFNFIID